MGMKVYELKDKIGTMDAEKRCLALIAAIRALSLLMDQVPIVPRGNNGMEYRKAIKILHDLELI